MNSIRECPNCGSPNSRVIDSREQGGEIRRRRRCLDCYETWGSIEVPARVEKKDFIKVKLDEGAYVPQRAHETDAGLDIMAKGGIQVVPAQGSRVFHTGVHVQLPHGYAGLIVSKSGLNVKHNITSTGLIDEGYTGEIVVKLFNHGTNDYTVINGDKISQLVIIPVSYLNVKLVKNLEKSERGDNGFGSTGR